MSYTLSNLLSDALSEIGELQEEYASSGSTTVATISDIAGNGNDNDYKNGLLFVLETTDGLAPVGEYKKITASTASTGTITAGTFSAAIGAGDVLGLFNPSNYATPSVVRLVNRSLKELGEVPLVDTTTLTSVDEQTEYSCSVDWKHPMPVRIDVQTNQDTDNNVWVPVFDWEYIPALPGSAGKIVFGQQFDSGYSFRVWYMAPHPEVNDYNDVINEAINPALITAKVVEKLLLRKLNESSGEDKALANQINVAQANRASMEMKFPIYKPNKLPRGIV